MRLLRILDPPLLVGRRGSLASWETFERETAGSSCRPHGLKLLWRCAPAWARPLVSFLVRARVTQYLPRQVLFVSFLAGVITFVISVFRPREVATVAAADSALYFVLDDTIYSVL